MDIGDSTSESLISNNYLNPPQQLPAQYARVGVSNVNMQISGARSIVETYQGQPNAYQVAQQVISQGYHGCWVLALGTNDAADVAVGSNVGMAARVHQMMSVIGSQPVMWVNVISLLTSGDYAESYMQQWNQTLLQACPQYPNMRVFNWASLAQPSYFIADGIHYNSAGSALRAADMANALAQAFPAASAPTSSQRSRSHSSQGHSSQRSHTASRRDRGSRATSRRGRGSHTTSQRGRGKRPDRKTASVASARGGSGTRAPNCVVSG